MSTLSLKYGNGVVTLNVRNAATIEKLLLPAITPLKDVGQSFVDAATYQCVSSLGLNVVILPTDHITIVLRDHPQFHPEHLITLLTYYLNSLGIPYENMAVLIACGIRKGHPQIIPPELAEKITVVVHDCDSHDLVSFGTTSHGTPVLAHPLLRDRKVIIVDAVRRNPLTGFSGGPECLLKVCGRATSEGCYSRAITNGMLSPNIQSGLIVGNPLCEEMTEISRLINPFFAVHAITDFMGHFFRFICGNWLDSWYESCNVVQQSFGVPISGVGDIVAASCGGYPYDITLQTACRSLCHAAQTVRIGGTIILAAECHDGGPDSFLNATEAINSPSGLSQLLFQSLVKNYHVLIQSKVPTQALTALGAGAFRTMETLEAQVDFKDKVVRFLPFADIAAPYGT